MNQIGNHQVTVSYRQEP